MNKDKLNKTIVTVVSIVSVLGFSTGYVIGKERSIPPEKPKTGYQILQEGYERLNQLENN